MQYDLPHPLTLLHSAPDKKKVKSLVRLKITEYWQALLTAEAMSMSSLQYINPTRHSVVKPHHLWIAAGSNPHEINKSIILARMMSGRYRTERLCRFWSADNKHGYCQLDDCHQVTGDLEHLLLHCPGLDKVRTNLEKMWLVKSAIIPPLQDYVVRVLASSVTVRMAFILDCTSVPEVITLYQAYGTVVLDIALYMTRTYVYGLHRKKQILIGKWPYAVKDPDCSNDKISHNNYSVAGPVSVSHLLRADLPCDAQPEVLSPALPEEDDPPRGACSAGQHSTSTSIVSITSPNPCRGDRHESPSVYKIGDQYEVLGHSEHVHPAYGGVYGGVAGLASEWEGYQVNDPSGMHDMQQQSSAGVQHGSVFCGGESGPLGCASSAVNSDSLSHFSQN